MNRTRKKTSSSTDSYPSRMFGIDWHTLFYMIHIPFHMAGSVEPLQALRQAPNGPVSLMLVASYAMLCCCGM